MTHAVAEWRNVDIETFRNEIRPAGKPAILRGLVAHWPAVQAGMRSPRAFCDYLDAFHSDQPVDTLVGDPSINGHFFYREDMSGGNFERTRAPLRAALARLLTCLDDPAPPALSVQAASVAAVLPGFAEQNQQPLLGVGAQPRIWIGNAVIVQTHYDLWYNIACVVAGQRRFTLFSPQETTNLYVGPFDFTPAGTPVSMASLESPDFEHHPRLRRALAAAHTAELEPGDALYVPFLWWHHVRSIGPFNALVNYWWNEQPRPGAAYDCLLHAAMRLRDLPADQRAAWRCMFDHFVFRVEGEPMAHLAPEHRGMLGPMDPERIRQIRLILARSLGPEG